MSSTGVVGDVNEDDLATLLPGGTPAHLFPPRGWHVSVESSGLDFTITAAWPKTDPAGARYFVTAQQLLEQAGADGSGQDGLAGFLAGKAAGKVAQKFLDRYGYVPVVLRTESRPTVTLAPHIRTTMSGIFTTSAGEEQWTCGTSWSVAGGAVPDTISPEAMAVLYGAAAAYVGVSQNGTGAFYSEVVLQSVEYAHVLASGKIGGGQVQRYFGAATPGTGGNGADFASSMAVTLDAGGARGGRYGRFYPPPQKLTLGSGVVAGQGQTTLRDLADGWLTAINAALNAAIGPDVALVVASSLNGGQNRNVQKIRLGGVPDHISKRRRGLSESYVDVTWPPAS